MIEFVISNSATACTGWIDGRQIKSEQHFYLEIGKELQLPEYFGHNLDALYDLLTDPDYLQGRSVALCFKSINQLIQTLGEEKWCEILSVLKEAHSLHPDQIAFYLLPEKD